MSVLDDKCFKHVHKFCTVLTEDLLCGSERLHLKNEDELCILLGSNYYTYLTLTDGFAHEVVKVCVVNEKVYTVERGLDGTKDKYWPCSTEVTYDGTAPSALVDLWRKADEDIPEDPYEPESLYSGHFCVGRFDYRVKNGKIVACRQNKNMLDENCYDNPVITVDEDGCISAIAEGSPNLPVYSRCKDDY